MAKYLFSLLLLYCLAFSSCQTMEQIPIEYMMPAEINFPPELRRVVIVNNTSSTPDNKWIETDSSQKDNEIVRAVAYHNGDAKIATESLAEAIAHENYFDEVIICDSALRANDKFAREETLTQEEVKNLTESLDVDFLIALENLQLKATKTIRYIPNWNYYYGGVDVKVYPTIRIYIPKRKNPMLTIAPNDSIFWEEVGNTSLYVQTHLIPDSLIQQEASEFAGTIPVKHLLPYWTSATRNIYNNGSVNMRDAAIYVRENSWDKAFKLWEEAFNTTKSDKKKMQSAHNIAVYYEIKDKLEQAETWALKARELAHKIDKIDQRNKDNIDISEIPNYVMTSLYVAELQKRTAGLPSLNMQMNRFNDDF